MESPPPVPNVIERAIRAVEPPDPVWVEQARQRQLQLAMPPGSLGRLLELGQQLAGIQRTDMPRASAQLLALFVADHGVAQAGVSAYPKEVTGQMLAKFLSGGAAINAIVGRVGAALEVVDMGVASLRRGLMGTPRWRFQPRPIRAGTSNFLEGPAMSREEAYQAFADGLQLGSAWVGPRMYHVIGLGDMGIGNTTTAAALVAALTGSKVEDVVDRGSGLDDEGLNRKRAVVEQALQGHGPHCRDLWDWLARIGGFEILGLAGLAIAAARGKTLVVLDGLASVTAGLIAAKLCPAAVGSMVAAHRSTEPGQRIALEALGLDPLLDLGLRLGEGTGAALAFPIIAAAADLLREMETFDSGRVSGP